MFITTFVSLTPEQRPMGVCRGAVLYRSLVAEFYFPLRDITHIEKRWELLALSRFRQTSTGPIAQLLLNVKQGLWQYKSSILRNSIGPLPIPLVQSR